MKTIYLDVLIVLNIYVNFFLLKAAARFTHTPLKNIRCASASAVGSLFSLTILLPPCGALPPLILKITAAAVIVFTAFGKSSIKLFLRRLLYFYIINFIFAGLIMLMYLIFEPSFMTVNNSYFYVDFSLISLVIFTAIAYLAVALTRRLIDRHCDASQKYTVTVVSEGRSVTLEGIADTGNSLTDSFSGRAVVICPKKALGFEGSASELCEKYGFRLLPYSTIGNSGLIAVFTPEKLTITKKGASDGLSVKALIGLSDNVQSAVFPPNILS